MDRTLVVLALLPLLAAPARGQSAMLTSCQALMNWIDGNTTFPKPGTTFCPTDKAFEKFAKDTGFNTWQDLVSAAYAAPGPWRPYLERLMQYARSAAYVPSDSMPKGDSTIETLLVASLDQAGALAMEAMQLSKGGGKKGRVAIKFGSKNRKAGQPGRARVEAADALKTDAAVVHAVDQVLMPPDTYYTLRDALRRVKDIGRTGRLMRKLYEREIRSAATWATVVAPMDSAWKALKMKEPFPAWTGKISGRAVQKDKLLQRALMQYAFLKLPAGDVTRTLDHNRLLSIWRLASNNMVSMPTGLVVNNEQQTSYYTYDASMDQIYVVGHRNLNAQTLGADSRSYMAGGALQKRTVYAGCSTILLTDSFVPLPKRTGLTAYDETSSSMA